MNNEFFIKIKQNRYVRYTGISIICLICYGTYVWSNTESTDNAYIDADIALVSPEINGVIREVFTCENNFVEQGKVIAKIEDSNYQAIYNQSIAALNAAAEDIKIATQNIKIAKINLEKSNIALTSEKTNYEVALADYKRIGDLKKDKFASQKLLDDAKSKYIDAEVSYNQSILDVESAKQNLALSEVQKLAKDAAYEKLLQAKNLALKDLDNTNLKAPISGIIANTNSSLVQGNYVRPGGILYSVVPKQMYVRANFKETQIAKIKTGMKTTLTFDSLPGKKIKGIVRNFSPATGSKFTLLPQDNATGNFTKIVQRVPIIIDFETPSESNLTPGMSTTVSIKTNQ